MKPISQGCEYGAIAGWQGSQCRAGATPYVRHRPERTRLYPLVEEYYTAFKADLGVQGKDLPAYVAR